MFVGFDFLITKKKQAARPCKSPGKFRLRTSSVGKVKVGLHFLTFQFTKLESNRAIKRVIKHPNMGVTPIDIVRKS